jgi:hypothetical protein
LLPSGLAVLDDRCSDSGYVRSSATHIIVGSVERVEGRFAENGVIYSIVTLEVETVLKGDLEEDTIQLRHLGGTIQFLTMVVEDEPVFTSDERVRVYVTEGPGDAYVFPCGYLGKEKLEPNPDSPWSPYETLRQSMDIIFLGGAVGLVVAIFYGLYGRPSEEDVLGGDSVALVPHELGQRV